MQKKEPSIKSKEDGNIGKKKERKKMVVREKKEKYNK